MAAAARGAHGVPGVAGPGRTLGALLAAAALAATCLWGCGTERQTEYGPGAQVAAYMKEVRQVLQELRQLNRQLAEAVPGDTVATSVIIPLIADRFRPALAGLEERATRMAPTPQLEPVHRQLQEYLRLWREGFDLALQGDREGRPELFSEFGRRQLQADQVGRVLEDQLARVRQALPGGR
jgi:hypothetical protein